MKFSFGKVSSLYGDWRDWFLEEDQSTPKYSFKFYVDTTYIGEVLLPSYDEVIVEIIGECITKAIRIDSISYTCEELHKDGFNKFESKILNPGDTVTIQFKLQFDIEEL